MTDSKTKHINESNFYIMGAAAPEPQPTTSYEPEPLKTLIFYSIFSSLLILPLNSSETKSDSVDIIDDFVNSQSTA